jgi:hypothetical protein
MCSGLGETGRSVQGKTEEREGESTFTVLDAVTRRKFKGRAMKIRKPLEFLGKCTVADARSVPILSGTPARGNADKKMPGGSGESTGQRAPVRGNRNVHPGKGMENGKGVHRSQM